MGGEDPRAVLAERGSLRAEVEGLQTQLLAERSRAAEWIAAEQLVWERQTVEARAETMRALAGDSEIRRLLEDPPPLTEQLLARLTEEHQFRPLLRHIDLSERQRRLDRQKGQIVELGRLHEEAVGHARRLAQEKRDAREAHLAEVANSATLVAALEGGLDALRAETEAARAAGVETTTQLEARATEIEVLRAQVAELVADHDRVTRERDSARRDAKLLRQRLAVGPAPVKEPAPPVDPGPTPEPDPTPPEGRRGRQRNQRARSRTPTPDPEPGETP